jgi:hypothetical protein
MGNIYADREAYSETDGEIAQRQRLLWIPHHYDCNGNIAAALRRRIPIAKLPWSLARRCILSQHIQCHCPNTVDDLDLPRSEPNRYARPKLPDSRNATSIAGSSNFPTMMYLACFCDRLLRRLGLVRTCNANILCPSPAICFLPSRA